MQTTFWGEDRRVSWCRTRVIGVLLIVAACGITASSTAAEYPVKPIRMVNGFPPGGAIDPVVRLITPQLTAILEQPVVIDYRPGASGTIGAASVAKAPPDGYVLFIGVSSTVAVSPSLIRNLSYDTLRDLTAVAQLVTYPNVLVVHPSVPVSSVKELIALARARPGQLNYSSGGAGTSNHLAAELFKLMAHVRIMHLPYKGGGPAVIAVMAGEADMMFSTIPSVLQHIHTGRLRALAVTGLQRSPSLPDVRTVSESGLTQFEVVTWAGILAPAGTPREIVARLNGAINQVLRLEDVRSRIVSQGTEVVSGTPEQFAALIRQDTERWAKVIKAAGITPE